mmetsp:Transcript_75832/g.158087  ORF Transcript_75832/g.158087 Transcript_75832/m.158087 type:complete len:487 (-) Transcript_75832:281-1741(-)
MVRAASALYFSCILGLSAGHKYPIPPRISAPQEEVFKAKREEAAELSAAATPEVLEFFSSTDFREAIKDCCPEAYEMDSKDLLEWFRAETRVAELAHAFPVGNFSYHFDGHDFGMPTGEEYKFLLNSYHAQVIDENGTIEGLGMGGAKLLGDPPHHVLPGPTAEENIFGLPVFKNESMPTWTEASTRLSYVANNLRQVNFGSSPGFGEATLIFNNDEVKDMVLAAPVDTGLWEMGCNKSFSGGWKPPMQFFCKGWNGASVGTYEHFDHLILPNLDFWRLPASKHAARPTRVDMAKKLFQRSAFATNPQNLTGMEVGQYFETNIVGQPRFPESVRFVIGNFATLFGHHFGRKLQKFCNDFGWPLVWAYTEYIEEQQGGGASWNSSHALLDRILDPTVEGSKALNITIGAERSSGFEDLWNKVAEERAANTTSKGKFMKWWRMSMDDQLTLTPTSAKRCGPSQKCVGYSLKGKECACLREMDEATIVV